MGVVNGPKYLGPVGNFPMFRSHYKSLLSKEDYNKAEILEFSEGIKNSCLKVEYKNGITTLLVHLSLDEDDREIQLEELICMVGGCDTPVVLMGDFNTEGTYHRMGDLETHSGLTRLELGPTFPSYKPERSIDHFFISEGLDVKEAKVLPVHYSDHLPVYVELDLQ